MRKALKNITSVFWNNKSLLLTCGLLVESGLFLPLAGDFTVYQSSFVYQMPSGYRQEQIGHFLVRYYPEDRILIYYLRENLIAISDFLERKFQFTPLEFIPVEIYPTKSSFSVASTLGEEVVEKSGTVGICKFGKIMIVSPRVLPWGYRWLDTLAHEYTHYLINSLSAGKCPLWLHEGIAHYCDTWWRKAPELSAAEKNCLSKALKTEKLIPFEKMAPSLVFLPTADDISLAFAEVKSVLLYINDFSRVRDLLLKIAEGRTVETSFQSVFGQDWKKFNSHWKNYLREKFSNEEGQGLLPEIKNYVIKDEVAQFVGPDVRGRVYLGERMYQLKEFAGAERQFAEALNSEPDNPVIITKLVRCLIAQGKISERAVELLERAIARNPDYYVSYILLGEIYFQQGKIEKARKVLEEALTINPFYRNLHYLLSQVYSRLGLFELSRQELDIFNSL